MPGAGAPGACWRSQDDVEPSRTATFELVQARVPTPGVLHCATRASVRFGTTPMSEYSALPVASAAMVFTHGTPWSFLRADASWFTLWARSASKKWLMNRSPSEFGSRIAYATKFVQPNSDC